MSCLLLHIRGRVQGVGFRYYTQAQAERLGIRGWVRNLPDGCVETFICGNAQQLASMQAWLAHGPTAARVDRIDTLSAPAPDVAPPVFTIR